MVERAASAQPGADDPLGVPALVVRALGLVIAALGSAGFVAAAGGAILWTRFDAAQLPADQAVAAVPRAELVVVGAVALGGFALAAIAALVLVYLLDRNGTAGARTRIGLVVLAVVEVAIAVAHRSWESAWTAPLLCAGLAAAGLLLVMLLDDAERAMRAPDREGAPRAVALLLGGGGWIERARRAVRAILLALGVAVVVAAPPPIVSGLWLVATLVALPAWRLWRADAGGLRALAASALLAYGLAALIAYEAALAVIVAIALALGALNLAVARATSDRFALYGICVFASVVVFGAALGTARTREHPKLQGVAVALADGGPIRCGLYVAETDSRFYLAHVDVVPRGRTVDIVPQSGRILSLPRAGIEHVELGPLEGVDEAQARGVVLRSELRADRATAGGAAPAAASAAPATVDANACSPQGTQAPPRETPQRTLAERFQPRLVVDRADGFWPVSVLTMFDLQRGSRRLCRDVARRTCIRVTQPSQLPWIGGVGEWLEYPGPDTDDREQQRDMVRALGSSDPAQSARQYFFVTGGDGETTSIQYWFYYVFNYQRVGPGAVRLLDAGFHEGDFESTGILLSKGDDPKPVYVWTPRHANEGRPLLWSESTLRRSAGHATVYAARGSHATYDACLRQRRPLAPLGLIDDRPQCDPQRQLTFEPQITPLSDLALAPWACWQGRFGHASRAAGGSIAGELLANGPESPLWQQRFGGPKARPCDAVRTDPPRPNTGEEVLDDATAALLRERGGRLDGLFDQCSDWERQPPSGVYVVACDEAALGAFFASGLTDAGGREITIRGATGAAERPSVPAVLRRPDEVSPAGARLSATQAMTVRVYAACWDGARPVVAQFASVPLEPGRTIELRTGARGWTLGPSTATPSGSGRCRR